ncbi:cytochrome c3 family protein [Geobacter sp.]|uniref:cytochrome c3 family protein n=1 Tax=Geobacter sp. TaxID=46610 RepID=UPI00263675AA|nr:cytochrome c3 family protein [Geobacter sp.]
MKARLTLAVVAASLAAATVASAGLITGSKHDLSAATGGGGKTTQICVFCHTPHNPKAQIPLWNRSGQNANTVFKLYTSSATLNMYGATKPSGFSSDSISLFCMSCHDGSPLGGGVHNLPSDSGGTLTADPRYSRGGVGVSGDKIVAGKTNFGTDLTKSHPVNIPYNPSLDANGGFRPVGGANSNEVNVSGSGATNNLPLFKATINGSTVYAVECASCHAVHGSKYVGQSVNFLRTTMKGSLLCLACHNK